jgi:hypothetical protein
VTPLLHLAHRRYFGLRDAELASWRDEPETFFENQDIDGGLRKFAVVDSSVRLTDLLLLLLLLCSNTEATPRTEAATLTAKSVRTVSGLAERVGALLERQLAALEQARAAGAHSPAAHFGALRLLDALYCLAGVVAFDLHPYIDFARFLSERLLPLMTAAPNTLDGSTALLLRRVIW